jgi:hypothetical protein
MTDHKNDERTVQCPIEGCDATPLARGINLHIRRSSGEGHGPQGEVLDDVDLDDLETVGEREVAMDYPDERDTENHARLCPYCRQTFAGVQGLMIHLGQKAGRDNHPRNPKDRHEPGDFPRVEADAEGNIERVVGTPPAAPPNEYDADAIPVARVFRLIADLLAEGEVTLAERVRLDLLADRPSTEPIDTAHTQLFQTLVEKARADPEVSENRIGAALEDGRIAVSCGGQSASLTAAEARYLAEQLRQKSKTEGWHDADMVHFVGFLKHCADILDGKVDPLRGTTEFQNWE